MRARSDWAALLIVPVIALLALPSMSFSTWLTLTVAGAAMGMMLFLMASGLTLIFGLMDVLNFAHGAFITLGRVHRGERAGRIVGLGVGAAISGSTSPHSASRSSSRPLRAARRARCSSASSSAGCTARICARS